MRVEAEKLKELASAWRANADKFDEAAASCHQRSAVHSNPMAAMVEGSKGDSCTNAAITLRKCADDLDALLGSYRRDALLGQEPAQR
jgi:hypothetical protein